MAKEIREKKVEVNIDGRIVRVMPHMVSDISKFGGSETRRVIKETPKELMHPLPKKLLLSKVELPKEELPEKLVEKLNLPTAEFPKEQVIPVEPLNEPPADPVLTTEKTEIVKAEKKAPVKKTTKKGKK